MSSARPIALVVSALALGGVALSLLARRSRSSAAPSSPKPLEPLHLPPIYTSLDAPAPPKWQRLKSPATLRRGFRYAAVIQLRGIETLASDATVAAKLREIGPWENLKVWSDPSETPRDFPGTRVDATGRRWATGTFAGKAKSAKLPAQLAELWGST